MTNRLKQAWLALCGKLEPEVREVPVIGEPHLVSLYRPTEGSSGMVTVGGYTYFSAWAAPHYLTCEEAHAASDGAPIEKIKAIRVGARYFTSKYLGEVEVPKPKIAKGKRHNGE